LSGGCHCGGIRYDLVWPESPVVFSARQCSCSYCARFRGNWTSHPAACLLVSVGADAELSHYCFESKTADFLFCSTCGVTLFATCVLEGRTKAVLNINTLEPGQEFTLDSSKTSFDGETTAERLERRNRGWIGSVKFE
jgi:hypothetical protein